jgi:hypothetical protein
VKPESQPVKLSPSCGTIPFHSNGHVAHALHLETISKPSIDVALSSPKGAVMGRNGALEYYS